MCASKRRDSRKDVKTHEGGLGQVGHVVTRIQTERTLQSHLVSLC